MYAVYRIQVCSLHDVLTFAFIVKIFQMENALFCLQFIDEFEMMKCLDWSPLKAMNQII